MPTDFSIDILTKHDRHTMSDLVIIHDAPGRHYHYNVHLGQPISQVLDSLADYLTIDKSLLELTYRGRSIQTSQTFTEIGYERLSAIEVTCPIDRVSERSAQLDFLINENFSPEMALQALEMSNGNLREAVTLARYGMVKTTVEEKPKPEEEAPKPERERVSYVSRPTGWLRKPPGPPRPERPFSPMREPVRVPAARGSECEVF
jgi:hypothetical protein